MATPLAISVDTMFDLEDNLLLFFTGFSRSAGNILKDQQSRTRQSDSDMLSQSPLREGARPAAARRRWKPAISPASAELMHEHWEHKKRRSGGMSNPKIDEWYDLGIKNGAVGGQARRRRRRRLPDVLRQRPQQAAPRHGPRRA